MSQTPAIPAEYVQSTHRYEKAPPGLPPRCIVISNSERRKAICPRQYLLSTIEALRPRVTTAALEYGSLWHGMKERGVYPAWMEDRSPRPDEIEGAIKWAEQSVLATMNENRLDPEECFEVISKLRGNLEAWLRMNGAGAPPVTLRMIGFEIPLAMPILTPSGSVYAPEVYVVDSTDEDGGPMVRLARSGEMKRARKVRLPWYFQGRLDNLFLRVGPNPALYVADDKTSKDPQGLVSRLTNDPQIPSYLALVRYNVAQGNLRHLGIEPGTPVLGFWHRVTSSNGFSEPKVLAKVAKTGDKAGMSLSVDKRQRIPSWKFEQAIADVGDDPALYADFVAHLRQNVDASIERSDFTDYGNDEIDRFERELHGDAARIAMMWRDAVRARTLDDIDRTHPRRPVCTIPGARCDWMGPCMRDGEQVRLGYDVKPAIRWAPIPDPSATQSQPRANDEGYPNTEIDPELGF